MRGFLFWLAFDWDSPRWLRPLHICLAPWIFALACGRWPHRLR